jgi:hypothetical protein
MMGEGFTPAPIWQTRKRGGFILAGEREYKGAVFFELRYWAEGGDKPTKQGVTFSPDEVGSLAEALAAYAKSRKAISKRRKADSATVQ